MIPQMQICKHSPDEGIYGDCYRAAIASILDRATEDVPHFFHDGSFAGLDRARAWLLEQGIRLLIVPFDTDNPETVLKAMAVWFPDTHYMMVGRGVSGANHVVVCRNDEIVHDPSPRDSSVVGADENAIIWVEVLALPL